MQVSEKAPDTITADFRIRQESSLRRLVASLEGGIDAFALSSGMAAITLLMEIFKPGDHIIAEADLYGGSVRLFDNVSKKNGYEFTYLNCSRDDIEGAIKENTKAVYIETPTNPMMNVSDISKIRGDRKKTRTLPDRRQHIPVPIFSESVKTRRGYRDPQSAQDASISDTDGAFAYQRRKSGPAQSTKISAYAGVQQSVLCTDGRNRRLYPHAAGAKGRIIRALCGDAEKDEKRAGSFKAPAACEGG